MARPAPQFPAALTAAFASALLLAGCGGEPAAPPQRPPVEVAVVTLQPEPITLSRELPARITPSQVAEVRPQVSGIVKRRLFTEGGKVTAGDPLYQLDDATYQAELSSAKAALARAEATQRAAERSARRVGELATTGAVSRQDRDNAEAALDQARADVGAGQAEVRVSHARIVAPISGRVGMSTVTAGALVTANQETALATIQQLDPVYVVATVPSAELLALRRELKSGHLASAADVPVALVLEDGSRHAHDGTLAFAELNADPATGSVLVRIETPNPEELLLPGTYVRAEVATGQRSDALLVPQQGIARSPKGESTALVVGADGKVEQRVVQVSRTVGDRWLVEGGLAAGEQVIVEGLQKVRPGDSVRAVERGTTAAAAAPNASDEA
jgi:membrane fusion protein, multidrug efflux system